VCAGGLLLLVSGAFGAAAGQERSRLIETPDAPPAERGEPCDVVITGVTRNGVVTTHSRSVSTPSGGRNVYIGGGVDAT
jgi:hypothetical protein